MFFLPLGRLYERKEPIVNGFNLLFLSLYEAVDREDWFLRLSPCHMSFLLLFFPGRARVEEERDGPRIHPSLNLFHFFLLHRQDIFSFLGAAANIFSSSFSWRPQKVKDKPGSGSPSKGKKSILVDRLVAVENGSMKGRNESSIPGSPATTVSHLH